MQMTFEQAQRGGLLQAFATRGNGYMMRSEKRPGSYGGGRQPGRRPRRKRAGFFYIFLTLLVSIILWPVGMVMLWRRKVRMQAGTKLLISLLTLCISVFLIVFALTVPVENEKFTAFQDRANDWLDQAAEDVAVTGEAAWKKSVETWDVMTGFAKASANYTAGYAADGLEKCVDLAGKARSAVTGLLGIEAPPAAPTEPPKPTEAPSRKPGAMATQAPATDAPSAVPATDEATAEPSVEELTAEPEPTEAANAQLPEETEAISEPTETIPEETEAIPEETEATPEETEAIPEATEAVPEVTEAVPEETESLPEVTGTVPDETESAALPELASTDVPTETPTDAPTEAPTAEPAPAYTVKPAADATIYFYESGSKGYHRTPKAHDMDGAPAHTLAEGVAAGKSACKSCGMPGAEALEIAHVAWVDADDRIHTSDECAAFHGDWRLMSLEDAVAAGFEPCAECGADIYREDIVPKPTATPEPLVVHPATPLKDAGEAIVYYFDASKGYHLAPECKGMSGAPAHTLAEAIAAGKRACGNCKPAAAELVGLPALWLDANGLCHTSDACASFKGQYSLIARDDALAQGLQGCSDCGADEYLVPGTVLAGD